MPTVPSSVVAVPEAGQICIWTLGADNSAMPGAASSLEAVLSPEERKEALRIPLVASRRQFIVGRAMLRRVLSSHFPVPVAAWRFARDHNRKPFVCAPRMPLPIQFSISHTEGLIACLVTLSSSAAVDVEKVEHSPDLPAVAAEFLSLGERKTLEALPGPEWTARFFDYWTLKEAYAKARGLGLQLKLSEFEFHFGRDDTIRMACPSRMDHNWREWRFWCRRQSSSHVISVAVRKDFEGPLEVVSRTVEIDASGFLAAAGSSPFSSGA